MFKYEVINDPTSVEKLFCENFKRKTPIELTVSERDFLLTLLLTNKKPVNNIPDKAKPYQLKIIENSIKGRFSFRSDDHRISLFIGYFGKSIGTCIMLLTMVQYEAKKLNQRNVDLEFICTQVFPMGFLKEEDLHELWEGQKIEKPSGGSANLLDYQTAMKSIQFL